MNKRDMIHALVDKLLDIEETSQKGAQFSYSTLNGFDFYFKTRPGLGYEWLGTTERIYFNGNWSADDQYSNAIKYIGHIANTPDPEPKMSFEMTESKAKALGLI